MKKCLLETNLSNCNQPPKKSATRRFIRANNPSIRIALFEDNDRSTFEWIFFWHRCLLLLWPRFRHFLCLVVFRVRQLPSEPAVRGFLEECFSLSLWDFRRDCRSFCNQRSCSFDKYSWQNAPRCRYLWRQERTEESNIMIPTRKKSLAFGIVVAVWAIGYQLIWGSLSVTSGL